MLLCRRLYSFLSPHTIQTVTIYVTGVPGWCCCDITWFILRSSYLQISEMICKLPVLYKTNWNPRFNLHPPSRTVLYSPHLTATTQTIIPIAWLPVKMLLAVLCIPSRSAFFLLSQLQSTHSLSRHYLSAGSKAPCSMDLCRFSQLGVITRGHVHAQRSGGRRSSVRCGVYCRYGTRSGLVLVAG